MCGILFILLWVIKREVDDDFRPVSTQEFESVVFCVNPLRQVSDHKSQVFGARLSKVRIKAASCICETAAISMKLRGLRKFTCRPILKIALVSLSENQLFEISGKSDRIYAVDPLEKARL